MLRRQRLISLWLCRESIPNENKARAVIVNRICVHVCLVVLLAGCFSSDRDNLQDPINKPILQIGAAEFNPVDGSVNVSWSFIGQGEISEFRVMRRSTGRFEHVGSESGFPGGRFERRTLSFTDREFPAGETLSYQIVVPVEGAGSAHTDVITVRAPGAALSNVNPDSRSGSVRVSWRPSADAPSVEVLREIGGVETVVFQSSDPSVRSFVDEGLLGNQTYTYAVRSTTDTGVQLVSRAETFGIWVSATSAVVPAAASSDRERTLIYRYKERSSTSTTYVYHHGAIETRNHSYTMNSRSGSLRNTFQSSATVHDRDLQVGSLSVDSVVRFFDVPFSTPLGVLDFPVLRLVAGVLSESGDFVVRGHSGPDPVIEVRWPNPDGESRAIVTVEPQLGTIYVAGGRTLRTFGDGLVLVDESVLPGVALDLGAAGSEVWSATEDGRLYRNEVTFIGQQATTTIWEEVPLPEGGQADGLSVGPTGLCFVLDSGSRSVYLFESDGEFILEWTLPSGSYAYGDILAASAGPVLVIDDAGKISAFSP
jgi:hypothetical protein